MDICPNNPNKQQTNECGCDTEDIDSDGDGVPDCFDACPRNPLKTAAGICGCDLPDTDDNADGIADCLCCTNTTAAPIFGTENGEVLTVGCLLSCCN